MLTLANTDNIAAKQDAGADVLFNLAAMDIINTSGLGSASTAQAALSTTATALITSPASGHSLVISNLKFTNTGASTRTITIYKDSAGTTYDATTQWGTPIVLFAGESAEWTSAGWVIYDANGVPKFASAKWPYLAEGTEPTTPAAGFGIPWYDTLQKMRIKDKNGLNWMLTQDGRQANYIINGEFDYAQRQVPGTLTTYSNTTGRSYTADRWGLTNENASSQYVRSDTSGAVETNCATRYYGSWAKITALGKMVMSQVIEAGNCLHLRGRTVRLQMKLKVDAARTVRIALLQLTSAGTVDTIPATFISAFGANSTDPTWGTNLAKVTAPTLPDNCTVVNDGLNCSVTTSWQRFGAVFTLPTDFKNLVVVVFGDSQIPINGVIRITEAGLYDGPEIREWNPRPQAEQLENCQRFYCKTFNVDTGPVQSAGALTGEVRQPSPVAASAAFTVSWTWVFPVRMYKAPTLTILNPQAANAQIRNQTLGTDCTLSTATADGEDKMMLSGTTPASTVVGNILGAHVTADAEL